jgi:DNA-binding response OmpR family regulator
VTWQPQPTVLVVEDDPSTAMVLVDMLSERGYRVVRAATGAQVEATLRAAGAPPDLVILDLRLPDADGLVLCATIRGRYDVPIIICSATARQDDRVLAFRLGADDFVTKPFDVDDLLARAAAVIRRAAPSRAEVGEVAPPPAAVDRVGNLVLSRERPRVRLGNVDVRLTPSEYRLLAGLMSRPDDVLTRDELAQLMWGRADGGAGRAVDVHVRRLRAKLAAHAVSAPPIVTVRGLGYRLLREQADLPL